MANSIFKKVQQFGNQEDGLALTEYLILLGLLTAGVIVTVGLFGDALDGLWQGWVTWLSGSDIAAPTSATPSS